MWNDKRSIALTRLCILFFMAALLVTVTAAPWLLSWFFDFSRPDLVGTQNFFRATIYIGSIPAAYLLYNLLALIRHIRADQVFINGNVELLRRISWTCFTGAGIAIISTGYYLPWVFLAAAAAFMGLIVRVVKNVVAKAVELQDEVDSII
ncbi:MAG: DUF2975 domain-containing protein [Syntrophomonadaceae bacterium]